MVLIKTMSRPLPLAIQEILNIKIHQALVPVYLYFPFNDFPDPDETIDRQE